MEGEGSSSRVRVMAAASAPAWGFFLGTVPRVNGSIYFSENRRVFLLRIISRRALQRGLDWSGFKSTRSPPFSPENEEHRCVWGPLSRRTRIRDRKRRRETLVGTPRNRSVAWLCDLENGTGHPPRLYPGFTRAPWERLRLLVARNS